MSLDDDLRRVAGRLASPPPGQDPEHGFEITWQPPLDEERVVAYEREWGIELPADYRAFITRVAGSGDLPFYGLRELGAPDEDGDFGGLDDLDPGAPFPYTFTRPLVRDPEDEESYDAALERGEADRGWVPLCTEGCGMDAILVVTAADPEVVGTVWYLDLANDCGILPLVHPTTREPLRFLDWLELCLDAQADDGGGPALIELVPAELFPAFAPTGVEIDIFVRDRR